MIWEIDEERTAIEGLDEDGRPDPAYAAALGLKPAPFGRRALASLIEFAFYALLQLPYWIVTVPLLLRLVTGELQPYGFWSHPNLVWVIVAWAVSFVLTLAFIIVQLSLHGRRGVTLGKAFTGIRSINVRTLQKPGVGKAMLRGLILWASFLVPVVGPALFLASPLMDREKRGRGWLDHAAGTWFVDVRDGLDPYHEKKMRVARKTVAAVPEAARPVLPSLATPAASERGVYRPGARISSGVVGAARPQAPGAPVEVGLTNQPSEPVPSETIAGMPAGGARVGGYRPGELSGRERPRQEPMPSEPAPGAPAQSAPAPERAAPISGSIIDSAPRAPQRGATPEHRPPSAPAPAPTPAPAASGPAQSAPAASHDTIVPSDLDEGLDERTVRRPSRVDEEDDLEVTRARPRAARAAAVLAFDTGERLSITGAALIGRNPAASGGEHVEHVLPIDDETRSVSKTHLLIAVAPLAAVDRGSTNGSAVGRDGQEHELEPGTPFPLRAGDTVRFGDRTLVVEEVAP